MTPRFAAALAAALGFAVTPVPAALAKEGAAAKTAPLAAPVALSAGRERQKACATEWRGFAAAEKQAQGPTWPAFYSKCVKRLKEK